MEYGRTDSFQKTNSHTPQPTTQFGSRPFPAPVQMKPQEQQTPEELENEAFNQNKFEAFGLQLKEKSGTSTPVEQEQLGLLQAKIDDFWAQRQERASQSGFDFSKVSVTPPGEPVAPQIQSMSRLGTPGMPLGGQRSLSNSPLQSSASPCQRKLTIGQPGDKYEQEADQVASQVVEQINSPKAAQSTQGQLVQRQEELVEELQAKPEITALQRQEEEQADEQGNRDTKQQWRESHADKAYLWNGINEGMDINVAAAHLLVNFRLRTDFAYEGYARPFSGQGSCETLSDEFCQILIYGFGFSGIKTQTESKPMLIDPGCQIIDNNNKTGNVDGGKAWIFTSHTWVMLGDQPIDVLFGRYGKQPVKIGKKLEKDRFEFDAQQYVA